MWMSNCNATVPNPTDLLVQVFLTKYQLAGAPLKVDYLDHGYDPSQCHLSAKHCAMANGGRRVHGWAMWQFGGQIDAEHHSVWEKPTGELVDVTPPKFGGACILFVRDETADIVEVDGVFSMWADRTTVPNILYAFGGVKIDEPFWGLQKSNAVIIDYCSKFGINPDDMLTDDQFG
jgi:hypothetical protein